MGLQTGGGMNSATSGTNTMLLLKLRRRNAAEWEFLATVLDRVLLIVFSFLVITVTGAMMAIGQIIHFSYTFEDQRNNITTPPT